ncbi:arsenate reductase (azurin) small subunit [Acidianus manzaensis]|uniref:Arsenate reductase (Azurin) small subunit n=1 Tax=Acidianus manzaensis TaxID=282676 RepID=A0A1W6JYC8_9CREN|nr:arsenate reductase (azurin) small subunit [Acidianus manzaensis]ARM75276.1 arsenate reductase (azurin) small subunit [Acidianus manzaensis]
MIIMSDKGEGKKKEPIDSNRRAIVVGVAGAIAGIAAGTVIGGNLFPKTITHQITEVQPEVKEVQVPVTKTVTQTITKEVPEVYPKVMVANYNQLTVGKPVITTYMNYPIVVVRTGKPSMNGVGPNNDVVAFSNVCAHMGYQPLLYDPTTACLVCPQHYSQYDLTRSGMQVIGHPNQYLAQVYLEYDESTGNIYAIGFNRLVYGAYNNVLQGVSSSSSSSS